MPVPHKMFDTLIYETQVNLTSSFTQNCSKNVAVLYN